MHVQTFIVKNYICKSRSGLQVRGYKNIAPCFQKAKCVGSVKKTREYT